MANIREAFCWGGLFPGGLFPGGFLSGWHIFGWFFSGWLLSGGLFPRPVNHKPWLSKVNRKRHLTQTEAEVKFKVFIPTTTVSIITQFFKEILF